MKNRNNKPLLKSLFSIIALLLSICAIGQEKMIKGVVTSDEGEALIGVTILIKGTSKGTVTGHDGSYQIEAQSDALLVFSYTGYQPSSIRVKNRVVLDVILREDSYNLDEVVVTGYSSIKRSDLVTAHTSLDAKEINRTINQTVEQALAGRAAGVQVTQNTGQPGGSISVNIRGISTINGNTQPLFVVDGVQIEVNQVEFGAQSAANPLATINPSDIESMEVLTGPVATSLYGSRATNGVVVIKTKSGQKGVLKIKYDYNFSLQAKPKFLDLMDLQEYASMIVDYYEIEPGPIPEHFEDPSILGPGTNWQEEVFNNAIMNKHYLSLSGGSEKTQYYISGEYFDQDGVALGSGFQRYSSLIKIKNQLSDRLSLETKVNLSQTNTRFTTGQEGVIGLALAMIPSIPVRNFDGTYAGGNSSQVFLPPNPIGLAEITTNEQLNRRMLGGVNFNYKILEGLNFTTSLNGDIQYTDAIYFQPGFNFGVQQRNNATLQERSNSSTYWNWKQMLTYDKSFDRHKFNIMGLHESQKSQWKNLSGGISDFVSDIVVDLNLGNSETATIGGGKGSWSQESFLGRINYNFDERYYLMAAVRTDGSSNFGTNNKWGVFPAASVAWRVSKEPFFNSSLINELRLRLETGLTGNQGSGGFIYGSLNTWTTPWGTGFALGRYANPNLQWEETFTNNLGLDFSLMDNRFQIEFDYYVRQTDELLTEASNPAYLGVSGSGGIANPFVNIGSIKNEGWTVQLETRNIKTKNFFWSTSFNFSIVDSKILSLNSESAFFDRTSWWMNNWTQRSAVGEAPWLFYGYVADGVFETLEELEQAALPVDNDGNPLPIQEEQGIYLGDVKYVDISGPNGTPDGIIDTHDQTYIGNPNAKYSLGLTNSFSYKGFDLSILVTGVFDYDIYNYTAYVATNPNNVNISRNFLNIAADHARIGEDANGNPVITNLGTSIPRINIGDLNGNYNRHSTRFVEEGSFIRLKNITLSYNLPSTFIRKTKVFKSMRISVSAQNLATFTNYSGYDPEVGAYTDKNVSASNQAQGVDNGRYPQVPLYSASVSVQF